MRCNKLCNNMMCNNRPVRKAAKLAVYEDIMIRLKNHQTLEMRRVDMARGAISEPEPKTRKQKNKEDKTTT